VYLPPPLLHDGELCMLARCIDSVVLDHCVASRKPKGAALQISSWER
jgi:hypothetical protein